MYKIDFNTDASIEMREAYNWYETQQKDLGERFFDTLDIYFEIICKTPFQNPKIYKNKRAAYVQDFPYQIIYSVYENNIVVFSVFHTKRNPKIWKKR